MQRIITIYFAGPTSVTGTGPSAQSLTAESSLEGKRLKLYNITVDDGAGTFTIDTIGLRHPDLYAPGTMCNIYLHSAVTAVNTLGWSLPAPIIIDQGWDIYFNVAAKSVNGAPSIFLLGKFV